MKMKMDKTIVHEMAIEENDRIRENKTLEVIFQVLLKIIHHIRKKKFFYVCFNVPSAKFIRHKNAVVENPPNWEHQNRT